MPEAAPVLNSVIETVLYTSDMSRTRQFYERVMGLRPMFEDGRVTAYAVGPTVLLLFQQGTTETPAHPHGGTIPGHDGTGRLHFAFAIDTDNLPAWRERLARNEVAIEGEVSWPRGAQSLYFRDPDQHLVELVTPGIWANY